MNEGVEILELAQKKENNRISFATITALILGYFTLCGALWNIGYWSTFQFNFFAYTNIGDLFKLTIYPSLKYGYIWIAIIILCLNFAIHYYMYVNLIQKKSDVNVSKHSKIIFDKYLVCIIIGSGFFLVLILFFGNSYGNLNAIAILTSLLIASIIIQAGKFLDYPFKKVPQIFVIYILVFIPIFHLTNAKKTAMKIVHNYEYSYVSSIGLSDTTQTSIFKDKKFLEYTEKYTFLLSNDSSVLLLDNGQIKFITYKSLQIDSNRITLHRSKIM